MSAAAALESRRARRLLAQALCLEAVERVFHACPPYVAARVLALGLRASGVRLGQTSAFWGLPTLRGEGDICPRLSVGEFCGFNFGCYFELDAEITFGDHVSVGHQVMFLTRTHDRSHAERRAGPAGSAPIRVGNGAWLGARSTILPGVTIGAGAVVGASVVVSQDVPPNILFTGNRKISLAKWR